MYRRYVEPLAEAELYVISLVFGEGMRMDGDGPAFLGGARQSAS